MWWVKDPLRLDAMRSAAARFAGMHDFRSFSDDDPDEIPGLDAIDQTCGVAAVYTRNFQPTDGCTEYEDHFVYDCRAKQYVGTWSDSDRDCS